MRSLAIDRRVVYAETIGIRAPAAHRRHLLKIVRRIKRAVRGYRWIENDLWVWSPIALPFHGFALARRFNAVLLRRGIRRLKRRLGIDELVIWSYVPTAADVIGTDAMGDVVYHCIDDYREFDAAPRAAIAEMEQKIAARAHLTVVSSVRLFELRRHESRAIAYVPHGVDAERFAAVDLEGLPGDVSDIPRPIAGFVGRIASWIDLELIRDCALALPEWSFVLVGPTNTALSELEAMPNVHCLGARDYEEVPGYVRAFDVCLAPFVSSALSESVNPLKVHEYLAAGKPVVATRMRELEPFADVVRLEKRSVFPEAIEDEAIRDSADRAMQRRASVTRTWSDVAETILDLLESAKAGEGEPLSSAGDRPVVDRVYRGRRCSEAGR